MGPPEIHHAIASRGHLNPGSPGVAFDRFELELPDLVRNVWVVRWQLGEPLTQRVLNYPAVNVVVEAGPQVDGAHHTGLYGPQPHVTERTLRGAGWAVGVLFRPAATPLLTDLTDTALLGADIVFDDAPSARLAAVMTGDDGELREILDDWLAPLAERIDDAGRLATSATVIAEERTDITTAVGLADALHTSVRTVERAVRRHTGFTPKQLIECRRMQDAATRLYADPDTDLSTLAVELGFVDHAHFSRRYRAIIGETPGQTRVVGRRSRERPGQAIRGRR
ncbi:helix-turn-helix domain-containing protein [Williamsia sp. M5A3_1d]